MNSTISHVLSTKPITAYLEQKGITPVKRSAGRLFYKCPFPDHKETQPSFVVYTNGQYENFYCFGCNRSYNIIHLVAQLEGISYAESLKRLGDGAVITDFDETKFCIEKQWHDTFSHPVDVLGISENLLILSTWCRYFDEGAGFDQDEVAKTDAFWKTVDAAMIDADFDTIQNAEPRLVEWLKRRKEKLESSRSASEVAKYVRGL